MMDKIMEAMQVEIDCYETGCVKMYYINGFPVNRAEFLLYFGKPTKEDVEAFSQGKSIERNGLQFDISHWNGI